MDFKSSRLVPIYINLGEYQFRVEEMLSDSADSRVVGGTAWSETQGSIPNRAVLVLYKSPRNTRQIVGLMRECDGIDHFVVPKPLSYGTLEYLEPIAIPYILTSRVSAVPPWGRSAFAIRTMRSLGELHSAMHTIDVRPELRPVSDFEEIDGLVRILRDFCGSTASLRSLRRAEATIQSRRPRYALLHGDFHSLNVHPTEHGVCVLDWSHASVGEPMKDVARSLIVVEIAAALLGSLSAAGRLVRRAQSSYLKSYCAASAEGLMDHGLLQSWIVVSRLQAIAHAFQNSLSGRAGRSFQKEQLIVRRLQVLNERGPLL